MLDKILRNAIVGAVNEIERQFEQDGREIHALEDAPRDVVQAGGHVVDFYVSQPGEPVRQLRVTVQDLGPLKKQ